MIFRIYHQTLGGHVHMRVFSGKRDGALGKCGDLCMTVEEFKEFTDRFGHQGGIQFERETLDETHESFQHLSSANKD